MTEEGVTLRDYPGPRLKQKGARELEPHWTGSDHPAEGQSAENL